MEIIYSVNLTIIIALNILFFFSGICLNSLIIVCFCRSVQLRKKLCYFMIMLLSYCDLLVVLIHHPVTILGATLWFTEKIDVYPMWFHNSFRSSPVFVGFSLNALVVMSFERYLATSYPIIHRTSVTKAKLSTLFAILNIVIVIPLPLSLLNVYVISYNVGLSIAFVFYFPPTLFFNYKSFMVARRSRRNNNTAPEMKKSFSLKNISSCVLAVACLVVLFAPVLTYVGLRIFSNENKLALNNTTLTGLWARTIASTNSTFNCLIFCWKNKILRTEGMKVAKILLSKYVEENVEESNPSLTNTEHHRRQQQET